MIHLPDRSGSRPNTTTQNPHRQVNQNGPVDLQDQLISGVLQYEGVRLGESVISGEGARAFILDRRLAVGPLDAYFMGSTEFAHLHQPHDGSLHAKLPVGLAKTVIEKKWGEPHPMNLRMGGPVTNIMIYSQRDTADAEIVNLLLRHSYLYARGEVIS
jgi:hypothetical protein